jgi:hypothetical protein
MWCFPALPMFQNCVSCLPYFKSVLLTISTKMKCSVGLIIFCARARVLNRVIWLRVTTVAKDYLHAVVATLYFSKQKHNFGLQQQGENGRSFMYKTPIWTLDHRRAKYCHRCQSAYRRSNLIICAMTYHPTILRNTIPDMQQRTEQQRVADRKFQYGCLTFYSNFVNKQARNIPRCPI